MSDSKLKHDPYCWICCKRDVDNGDIKCSHCIRSYHKDCLTKEEQQNIKSNDGKCPVCIDTSKEKSKSKSLQTLTVIMKRLFANNMFKPFQRSREVGSYVEPSKVEQIVNPIDLVIIRNQTHTYRSFAAFQAEFDFFVHNCIILYTKQHAMTKAARAMIESVNDEIDSVKKCAECYINAIKHPDKWFTMPCSTPHLLLWARLKGFNFWPAKLMAIDGQLINVRFFGDHTHADVPVLNCFLYSARNPDPRRSSTFAYINAVKEAQVYSDNIREYFGSFQMTTSKVQFNPALYENYITDMVPSLAERRAMTQRARTPKEEQESDDDQSHESEYDTSESESEEQQSMHSDESTKSSELQQKQKYPRVRLERIDVKQHETNRVLKRIAEKPITDDEPVRKSMRLNGNNVEDFTVDSSIGPEIRRKSNESDTDDSEQEENLDENVEQNEVETSVNNELNDCQEPEKLRIENNDQDEAKGSDEFCHIEDDEEKTDRGNNEEEQNDNEKDDKEINDGEKCDKEINDGEEIDEEKSNEKIIEEDKNEREENDTKFSDDEQNDIEIIEKENDYNGDADNGVTSPKASVVETVSNDNTESLQRNPMEDSASNFDRAIDLLTQAFQKVNEERNHAIAKKLKYEQMCTVLHARLEKLQQENAKLELMKEMRMCDTCKHTSEEERCEVSDNVD